MAVVTSCKKIFLCHQAYGSLFRGTERSFAPIHAFMHMLWSVQCMYSYGSLPLYKIDNSRVGLTSSSLGTVTTGG